MQLRVALAEDNLLVREGIQRILEMDERVSLVAVVADQDALLAAVTSEMPDVVLTDVRIRPGNGTEGIEIARTLRRLHPQIGVVVLTQLVEARYLMELLEDGSAGRGYLLKEHLASPRELGDALVVVANGGSVVDPKVVESLVSDRNEGSHSRLAALTPREREILREVAAGKSNTAIARDLVITKRAVEHHIRSIFSKLDLPGEEDVSRRVTAALMFLSEQEPR
jgi:DNA-binding NarL/FixJ family response regulator